MGANHTLVSKGTRIVGDVHFNGELNVEGKVSGTIWGEPNSELEIGTSGQVEGQINAPKIIVRGFVKGDIRCSKHVELGASAVVHGNVFYHMIEMVKGAQVNGGLVHVDEAEQKKQQNAARNGT